MLVEGGRVPLKVVRTTSPLESLLSYFFLCFRRFEVPHYSCEASWSRSRWMLSYTLGWMWKLLNLIRKFIVHMVNTANKPTRERVIEVGENCGKRTSSSVFILPVETVLVERKYRTNFNFCPAVSLAFVASLGQCAGASGWHWFNWTVNLLVFSVSVPIRGQCRWRFAGRGSAFDKNLKLGAGEPECRSRQPRG